MADKITSLKVASSTGTFGNEIPIGANASNINVNTTTGDKDLQEILGSDINGDKTIEYRLSNSENFIKNLNIGGRNLLKNTRTGLTMTGFNYPNSTITGSSNISSFNNEYGQKIFTWSAATTGNSSGPYFIFSLDKNNLMEELLQIGEIYTFSYCIKGDHDGVLNSMAIAENQELIDGICDNYYTYWKRCYVTFKAKTEGIVFCFYGNQPEATKDSSNVYLTQLKLEKGNVATDWAPNSDDYLSLSGGRITGGISFAQDALPEFTMDSLAALLGIESYASGGKMKYISPKNLTVQNANYANGHTVNSDVPSNAKFTDTTYNVVNNSTNGLMSTAMYYLNSGSLFSNNLQDLGSSTADFNDISTPGRYVFSSYSNYLNSTNRPPVNDAGSVYVIAPYQIDQRTTSAATPWYSCVQIYLGASGQTAIRTGVTENSTSITWGNWSLMYNSSNSDGVIYSGISGAWHILKWNNGNALCWKRMYYKGLNTSSPWGNIYVSYGTPDGGVIGRQSYPITFVSAPAEAVVPMANDSQNPHSTWLITHSCNTTTQSAEYEYARGTAEWADANLCYIVFGTWK